MIFMRRVTVTLALIALGACNGDKSPTNIFCIDGCPEGNLAVPFAVGPDSVNLLSADSVVATAFYCPPAGCFFNFPGVISNWSVRGPSVRISGGAGFVVNVNGRDSVLVKAFSPGQSWIDAVAVGDATKKDSLRIYVADSTSITRIHLQLCCSGDSIASVRDGADVTAGLKDTAGRRFQGGPTAWSISDTTILAFQSSPSKFGSAARRLLVKKPGTAYIHATFLTVRDSLRVTVNP